MRPRGEIKKLGPTAGKEGKAPSTEGGLSLGVTGRREWPGGPAAVELAAAASSIRTGGAVENGLSEEHTRQEMEEGTPARAVMCRGGGEVLKDDGGAVGKEETAIGGEDAGSAMLHEL